MALCSENSFWSVRPPRLNLESSSFDAIGARCCQHPAHSTERNPRVILPPGVATEKLNLRLQYKPFHYWREGEKRIPMTTFANQLNNPSTIGRKCRTPGCVLKHPKTQLGKFAEECNTVGHRGVRVCAQSKQCSAHTPSRILRPPGQTNHGRTPAQLCAGTMGRSCRGYEDLPWLCWSRRLYCRVQLYCMAGYGCGAVRYGMA